MKNRLLLVMLLGVAVMVGGYMLLGVAADTMAEGVSDGFETDLFASLGAKQKDWRDEARSPAEKKAAKVFDKLAKAEGLRQLAYKLYFADEKQPNAFALPGGSVGVTQGLLSLVETDIGLACVLGHEIGHQQYRHSLKAMGRALVFAGVVKMLLGGDDVAIGLALDLANRAHSRKQELDADAYGVTLVHDVYGTTKGAFEFFTKIEKDPATKTSKLASMLSTHPYTPDRIARMKKLAAKLELAH